MDRCRLPASWRRCAAAPWLESQGDQYQWAHRPHANEHRLRSRSSIGTVPYRASKKGPNVNIKYIADRAILFLGSMAAFAFVINGAKRW